MIKTIILILSFVLITNYANALTAEWLANPVGDQVTSYNLYYGKKGVEPSKLTTNTNGISIDNSSFEPEVIYSFSVSAVNSIGEGEKTEPVDFMFPVDPPDLPLEPDAPSGIRILLQMPAAAGSVTP